MEKVVLYANLEKYSTPAKKHVNVLNPPFSMDTHASKWMHAQMVKFGMSLSIHASAQILLGGMVMSVFQFLNAKEDKHWIACINASVLMVMSGDQILV